MTHHYDSSLVNTGTFDGIVFKNESFMIVTRTLDVPLRTTDGGKNWEPMTSCAPVAEMGKGLIYSWSGNTLIMMGSGGTQTEDHPYVGLMTRMSHMYISISHTLLFLFLFLFLSVPRPRSLSLVDTAFPLYADVRFVHDSDDGTHSCTHHKGTPPSSGKAKTTVILGQTRLVT